jgi:hypothetical protein
MSRGTDRDRRLEDDGPYDRRIIGYLGGDRNQPWNCHCVRAAWHALASIWSDEDKAEFVVDCHRLITAAREAGNDAVRLKLISDEARRQIWEIPSKLPVDGYEDISTWRWQYPNCLTADEIEKRLMAEITRMDLMGWWMQLESSAAEGGNL